MCIYLSGFCLINLQAGKSDDDEDYYYGDDDDGTDQDDQDDDDDYGTDQAEVRFCFILIHTLHRKPHIVLLMAGRLVYV